MKTNQEILDFFGVEKGKKYIVTKDTVAAEAGETFTIEVDAGGQLYVNYETGMSRIFALAYIEYAEIKEAERIHLGTVTNPFRLHFTDVNQDKEYTLEDLGL